MMNQSWVHTLVIQVFFCLAFYLVFQIGQPKKPTPYHHMNKNKVQRNSLDFHFISVVSSQTPLQEQTLLPKKLDKVIKKYNVQFVINISEYPLLMNVTTFLQQSEVPQYRTRSLKGQGPIYYHKKIDLPLGRTLDVTAINTKAFQEYILDYLANPIWVRRRANEIKDRAIASKDLWGPAQKNEFSSLTKMLNGSHSDWHIAVGYHSIVNCTVDREKSDELASEQLYHTLLETGVNAYLSEQTCPTFVPKEGAREISRGNFEHKRLSFASVNQKLIQIRENVDGFFLHRISALEFVSYLVNENGDVVRTVALQPKGREAM